MTRLLLLLILFSATSLYSQQTDAIKPQVKDTAKTVTVTVKFDQKTATKDGYYLGGYVVELNISDEEAKKLNGKKIKITGKLFIEKGLDNQPKQYDEKGKVIIMQGRASDTKHILSATFKIVGK